MNDRTEIERRLEQFYDPRDIKRWMHAPHPQLDGVTPIDAINSGRADDVRAIIDQLDSGAYT